MLFLTPTDYDVSIEQDDHPQVIKYGTGGIDHNLKDSKAGFKTYLVFIKKIAQQLWNGSFNFATCQVPTALCLSKTFLEVQADDYLYFTNACKKMLTINEPLKKLQYLATSVVATIHNSVLNTYGKTPLNCYIGETLTVNQKGRNV